MAAMSGLVAKLVKSLVGPGWHIPGRTNGNAQADAMIDQSPAGGRHRVTMSVSVLEPSEVSRNAKTMGPT